MLKAYFRGLKNYLKAHQIIVKHRLWRYLIIPGVISTFMVIGIIAFAAANFGAWANIVIQTMLPDAIKGEAVYFLLLLLMWILLIIAAIMVYKHITLALLSPVLGHLSEKTEQLLSNAPETPFSMAQLLKDLARGVHINLRNLALSVFLTVLIWPLSFVPVVGPVLSTILMLAVQAYYSGFGLMDCVLERRRLNVRRSVQFAVSHRPTLIGVGSGFLLLLSIPLLGWFLAPAYGTVAATLSAIEHFDLPKTQGAE
jgi:CysZ protein